MIKSRITILFIILIISVVGSVSVFSFYYDFQNSNLSVYMGEDSEDFFDSHDKTLSIENNIDNFQYTTELSNPMN